MSAASSSLRPFLEARWAKRLERATALGEHWGFAREVLGFYRSVARFQASLARSLEASPAPGEAALWTLDSEALEQLVTAAPRLVALVEGGAQGAAPPALMGVARQLRAESAPDLWRQDLCQAWDTRTEPLDGEPSPLDFFLRALLQPFAELRAAQWQALQPGDEPAPPDETGHCPACGGLPQGALLHGATEGHQRFLFCAWCSVEWRFKRVRCPSCGEEDAKRLAYHTAEELPHVRVEGCDTCRTYVKTVDLEQAPAAEPLVDELAALPLDVYARSPERGLHKRVVNLAGV